MTSNKVNLNISGNYTNTNILLQSVNSILNNSKNLLESAPAPVPAPAPAPNPDTIAPVIVLNPTNVTFEASLTNYVDDNSRDTISDNSFSLAQLTIDVCSNVIGSYCIIRYEILFSYILWTRCILNNRGRSIYFY